MTKVAFSVLAFLLLSGCHLGNEVARIPFTSDTAGETTATLAAGEVAFWTDLDLEYDGDAALRYEIQLSQGGHPVATASCHPLHNLRVRMSWIETNLGGHHSRRGRGKMACEATLAQAGPTVIQANLLFATRPQNIVMRRADLVIRQ